MIQKRYSLKTFYSFTFLSRHLKYNALNVTFSILLGELDKLKDNGQN